jgi:outer membrane receptor protein involved in Fe transport
MTLQKQLTTKKKYLSALIPLLIISTGVSASTEEVTLKDKNALETITVTSQKRSQNLQAVPVAVTAINAETITSEAIKDVFDLQANVPGLGVYQSQNATQASFSIRGVGTAAQNFGLESSVGLYVDGVYRSRQNAMINNYVDVETVEVLRGPQGTLFGKNTPMGAINVRTVAPSHGDSNAYIELGVGNYNLKNISGASSFTAIDDILTFRLTGFGTQRDGTVSDLELGKNKLNDRNRFGARVQALYTPTDDLTLRIIADYSKIDEICCASGPTANNFQATEVPGKLGSDFLFSSPLFNANIIKSEDFHKRETALSYLPQSTMEDSGLSAEISYELSNQLTMTSLTAYRDFSSYDNADVDFVSVDLIGKVNDAEQNSFSQELRLNYDGDNFHAIAGLYYFTQDLNAHGITSMEKDMNSYTLNGIYGGRLNSVLSGIDQISVLSNGLIAPSADSFGISTFENYSVQDHESYAAFGQLDYYLTNEFTITLGLRYTDESKELTNTFTENYASGAIHPTTLTTIGNVAFPETIVPGSVLYSAGAAGMALQKIMSGAVLPGTPEYMQAISTFAPFQAEGWGAQSLAAATRSRPDIEEALDDSQVTGTIKLAYQPNKETLLYASYGTGYKSGGTNTDRIDISFDPIFNAETSSSFEVGIKKDFPDQALRLNVAAHLTEVEDFQKSTYAGTGFNLQNAGNYDTSGIELESTWLPTDSTKVSLAYAYIKAEYSSFDKGACWIATPWNTGEQAPGQESDNPAKPNPYCNQKGNQPIQQPQHTALLQVAQDFEITSSIYGTASIDYNYIDSFYSESSNDPLSEIEASGLVNARLKLTFDNYDFDLLFWGRNITDEKSKSSGAPATLQDGKLINFYTEPATYGVTFKQQF